MGSGACKPARAEGRIHAPIAGWTDIAEQKAPVAKPHRPHIRPLIVLLHSARRIPKFDLMSESDPYVKAWGELEGKRVTPVVRWATHQNEPNPVWNVPRDLGIVSGYDSLCLELWDEDFANDDFIGSLKIPFDEIDPEMGMREVELPVKKRKDVKVPMQLSFLPKPRSFKRVFFVRHGESVWNKAQRDRDVRAMLGSVNHRLNETGRNQAFELSKMLEAAATQEGGHDHLEMEMTMADAVWTSPLMRSAQTALIAARSLLKTGGRKLVLRRAAREKRNFGGRDTTGSGVGRDAFMQSFREQTLPLLPLGGEGQAEAGEAAEAAASELFEGLEVDCSEVESKWWNDSREPVASVRQRAEDFLSQIRFAPENSIIVVGHSHYFRDFFRQQLRPDTHLEGASRESLQKKVLVNCGVAALDLDFAAAADGKGVITGVTMLFSSGLSKVEPEIDEKGAPVMSPSDPSPADPSPRD
eukprot:Hpha_TRINITY_DN27253_c0_g1::TRINITY_DN27253_c0_g1_i1::g.140771::m.140771